MQMDYRSKMFLFSLMNTNYLVLVSNVEYGKTCPSCVMRNDLFTCAPSNFVCLSDWEQAQKDTMLYLPILIAKIV